MTIARLLSPCFLWGHPHERVMELHGKALHLCCARCAYDFGPVLAGQRYKARKAPKPKKGNYILDSLDDWV